MTKVVIDSDVIIDFLRTGKGALLKLFESQKNGKLELFLSAVTVLELFAGKSSKKISKELDEFLSGCTVVDLGKELAQFAGKLKRDHNTNLALADLIVAATCLSLRAKIATRNKRHYQTIPKLRFYPISTLPSEPVVFV